MTRVLGFAALVGFCLSLAAHLAALFGLDVSDRFPYVWLLHVGIFVVFVPMVFSSRKALGPKPRFADIRGTFPTWVIVLGAVIFAYAIINFMLFIAATEGGNPSIEAGRFVLKNHGKLIRELSPSEYVAFRANELRGFSGHWLAFYFAPLAYFMFRRGDEA